MLSKHIYVIIDSLYVSAFERGSQFNYSFGGSTYMKSQCKLIITILALTILLIIPSIAQAQALPAVRLTAPTVVQAEVGREFVIPLTITLSITHK